MVMSAAEELPEPKDKRVDFRTTSERKRRYDRAAAMRGLSFSDFATEALDRAAAEVFQQHQTLVLSERGMAAFVDALLNPRQPDERSDRYAEAYREMSSDR